MVDNQSGAGGVIGRSLSRVPRRWLHPPARYKFSTFGLQWARNPTLETSFSAVATIAVWSHVLVVRPELPIHSLAELVAYAKANPGALTFGYGLNSTAPVAGGNPQEVERRRHSRHSLSRGRAGCCRHAWRPDRHELRHISDAGADGPRGKLRAIAYSGVRRTADLPDVPTVTEAGFPQLSFDPDAWAMVLAPTGTPSAIVDALNTAINEDCVLVRSPRSLQSPATHLGPARQQMPELFSPQSHANGLRLHRAAGLKAE